jgi:hypothetical protein
MTTPDKETVLQALVDELAYDSIKIGGDISAFQDELYIGFLKYLGKRKCTEKIFSNFIMAVADTLLEPEETPHRMSDTRLVTKAVGV